MFTILYSPPTHPPYTLQFIPSTQTNAGVACRLTGAMGGSGVGSGPVQDIYSLHTTISLQSQQSILPTNRPT